MTKVAGLFRRFARISFAVIIPALFIWLQGHGTAWAHEVWFVEEGEHAGEHFSLGLTNLIVVSGAAMFVLLAFAVHRAKWFRNLDSVSEKAQRVLPAGIEWRTVAVLAGIMLIVNSITGVFLAPDLVLPKGSLTIFGRTVQMVIGVLLVSQFSFVLAALAIVAAAVPVAVVYFPASLLIDYGFEYVSLTLALVFFGLSSNCRDRRICTLIKRDPSKFARLPLPTIRVGLGLTMVALSLHYKLVDPNLALTFLDKYDLNFMPYLGFSGFTNLHFVFAAGVAEVTLGLLLIAGVATRLAAAGLLVFLFTTLMILGVGELIGHLPVIGIALVLLYKGAGGFRVARSAVQSSAEPA